MKPVVPADWQHDTSDSECLKLADEISSMVLDKFAELTSQLTSAEYSRRKVLAGVVVTTPTVR